ncbi:putative reverse transcriptase domain-containing protein [Tanacetum coccineum]|uniref:Reverse transcriptase domain-containing protein n=1 Tax=Tanacetum coccineum TaxID=301880 RepID=A0ABQ4X6V6_9ASTR
MPPKKRTTTTTTTAPMTDAAIKALIAQGVAYALAEIEANKTTRNGDDNHDLGTDSRRTERAARECTYSEFLKCQPLNFKGSDRVVSLTHWFEKMKSVFHISNYTVVCQIKFATCNLLGSALTCLADRQAENKKKLDDTSRNNQNQQQPFKRHNVARAYTAGPRVLTCFEYGAQGHIKRDYPELKNNNHGNQAGNNEATSKAYAVGTAGTNPNSNVITGMFLLNNCYASILFDTGADRSFVSTAFSSLIDIIPSTLDHGYDVELVDELGSFDVIIGMDWLVKYHAVIVCDEKTVRIPFGNKILIIHGNGSNNEYGSRLNIISCTKTQNSKVLAHVIAKKAKDKSEEKRLEDVPIV